MARTWWYLYWLLSSLATGVLGADNGTGQGKALNVPPSQFWDGDDGPWSTFRIAAGNASKQQFRVLPASDQSTTWLVLPEACSGLSSEDCEEVHGGIYMRNSSGTWKEYGQYELSTYLESQVGYDGDGLYGFESLSLGWTGDGLPHLQNQSIAGIISPKFTLGGLALNPRPINFTNYNSPIPSLLQNLRNATTPIPSLSWSYTAGAYNLAPKVFGSLVLGGYDKTRFVANDIIFPLGADISLDFQVAVQKITMQSPGNDLMETPIISYISTLVPDIWLPVDTCEAFSKAFGLTYDNITEAYYVDAPQHQKNLDEEPVVKFQIGPDTTAASVSINMPYWNFYMAATTRDTNSIMQEGGFRFPIRRAAKDTQYILGRTFLQSAYLTADYDRSTFNLSQALYPSSSSKADIISMLPPGSAGLTPGNNNQGAGSTVALSTAAIGGIAVGGIIFVAASLAGVFFMRRRIKQAKEARGFELEDTDAQHNIRHEMPDYIKRHEVGAPLRHEMAGDENHKVELYACGEQEKPVEVANNQIEVHELPAHEKKYVEMEGEGHTKELG
ncbi:hypothetical protein ACN47E_000422 [Coniothyrium glycines]